MWLSVLSLGGQQPGQYLVIEGGTLIDGHGGPPVADSVVVVRGNRIETVSRKGQVAYPAGAQVLRADGKFILPGFMDAHCHYDGTWMPELMLNHGVTSVFEIGGGGELGLAQREAINRGKVPGPRLFVAVGSISGAQIAAVQGRTGQEGPLSGRQVIDTPDKAREVVQRFIQAGADMIKVHRGPPAEVYKAAIDEAHKAGLPVVAQPLGPTVYAREAVLAGADILEHSAGVAFSIVKDPSRWKHFGDIEVHSIDPTPFAEMDEAKAAELIRLMVDRNVYLEPDFIAVARSFHKYRDEYELLDYRMFSHPNLAYLPARRRQKILETYHEFDRLPKADWDLRHKGYQNMLRFTRQFVQAGGKIMTGTDTGGWAVAGLGLHHEFDILVREAGLTPMQVIVAATRNPAEGLRILDRVGTVQPGKFADLVVVNEDPLKDIRNLLKIEWVLKDGKIVDRAYHPWFENPLSNASVEGLAWVAALKRQTIQRDPTWAFGQPPPGIETVFPNIVTEGNHTLTLEITGINFTGKSLVYADSEPLPTELVSETELRATVDARLLEHARTIAITVQNPEPVQRPEWGGGVSNKAHLLVNFRYD